MNAQHLVTPVLLKLTPAKSVRIEQASPPQLTADSTVPPGKARPVTEYHIAICEAVYLRKMQGFEIDFHLLPTHTETIKNVLDAQHGKSVVLILLYQPQKIWVERHL